VKDNGQRPVVFVNGFGCAHTDWDLQIAHLSPRLQTIAVDLRGHGASPGTAAECSTERYGADVAEVMRALALPPAILVGHSMGCRVDGSQLAAAMEGVLKERFATPDGYTTTVNGLLQAMFTAKSAKTVAASIIERAGRLPRSIGEKWFTDMARYDAGRLTSSLASLRVPVMALQTTFLNEKNERMSLREGQTTPYIDMLRANVPSVRVEIITDTGHFPQLDESARTNMLIDTFLASVHVA